MDKQVLQTLKGFRDFLPKEAKKRDFLISKMKNTFELFGFEPLETPAIEYADLLMGKYGTEADKLVYHFQDEGGREVALRYDQTVPSSRILATYQQNLPMPWRRYQIQNVWRAEKPQKGRFREFTQSDIDIFGTISPLSDAEVLMTGYSLFKNLGFSTLKIFINDRNIIFDILKRAGVPPQMHLSVIQTIDKLDKKSREEIEEELRGKGVSIEMVHKLFDALDTSEPSDVLAKTIEYAGILGIPKDDLVFKPRLARGLDYYNSVIYEFIVEGYAPGSVAGGGRYDNLIKQLCGVDIPATGYSHGFDRIMEAMDQFGLFPVDTKRHGILVSVFNKDLLVDSLKVVMNLRENGIEAETYPDENSRLDKQLKYADKKGIKWLIVIGPEEVQKDVVILKDLETGHQEDVKLKDLVNKTK